MGRVLEKDRIVKVLIEYKKGKKISEIIESTGYSKSTIHRYLNVYNEKFKPKPPSRLSAEELEILNLQALEVKNALLFGNRTQSGRRKQDNIT